MRVLIHFASLVYKQIVFTLYIQKMHNVISFQRQCTLTPLPGLIIAHIFFILHFTFALYLNGLCILCPDA